MEELPDLQGRVAIVTGSGRGRGRSIARVLAAGRAAVGVVSRTPEDVAETVTQIERDGGTALALPADVTDRQAVAQLVRETEARLGPVDLLVNNAAILRIAPVWRADPDEWWRVLEINLRGPFTCTQAVLPGMMARRRGRIINVSSASAWLDPPYGSAYVASKAGLNRFTSSLADETREHGIVAFTLSPGGFGADNAMQEYLRTVDVPEWRRWRAARQQGGPNPSGGSDRTARQVAQLASGMLDALSGRIITYTDDVDDLARRAEEIVRENRNTVQYVK